MVCVDFGSGHNPRKGFLSCDKTGNVDLYYNEETNEIEGLDKSVDIFYLRNVVHHLPSIERVVECLLKYLTKNGRVVVIEPTRESFGANLFLDFLWYRGINKREDIEIFGWRDYNSVLSKYFSTKKKLTDNYKEITLYKRNTTQGE